MKMVTFFFIKRHRAHIVEDNVPFNGPTLWRGPCIWMNINLFAAKAASIYG